MFTIGTGWERYSWYLRLPCLPGGPWTGIVRIEAAPTLDVAEAVMLRREHESGAAGQVRLGGVQRRPSSAESGADRRAGNDLRHRLGYAPVVYRAIREAAMRNDYG